MSDECAYCDATFDTEDAKLSHYAAEHKDELSTLDQKKVERQDGTTTQRMQAASDYVLVGGGLLLGIIIAGFFIAAGGVGDDNTGDVNSGLNPETTPTELRSQHYHGAVAITVDGKAIDLSQRQYQVQVDAVHLEGGNGDQWHVHAKQVTVEYFLESLGFGPVTADSFSYDGRQYSETNGDSVQILVNGEEIRPQDYVLREGDSLRVAVESA